MKLSIITINYNNLSGLQRTMKSVLSQTFKDYEWIIIDGGSTDGSREMIERWQENIAYWCSEPDNGVYNAQNKGIEKAQGEYLSFLNSGDEYYESTTLAKVFGKETPNADVLYGDWFHNNPGHEWIQRSPIKMSRIYIYTENVCHQAIFTRSTLLKQKGYDETMKIFADWKRNIELVEFGCSFFYLDMVVCKYEPAGISGTSSPQNTHERKLLYAAIPEVFKPSVDEHSRLKKKLERYETNYLMRETYAYVFERPLYCHFVHLNLLFLKFLKKIVGFLKL